MSAQYTVEGKKFTWATEDGNQIVLPLRIPMRVVRAMPDGDLDVDAMFAILEKLAPDQIDAIDDMDANDFSACFTTWQTVYAAHAGASLGESSGSAPSSQSTGQPSTTTGEPVST